MNEVHVYIIAHVGDDGAPSGPCKIGITQALGARVAALNTGNWRELRTFYSFPLSSRGLAAEIEQKAHDDLAAYRLNGEWFDIDVMAALETLTAVVFDVLERRFSGSDLSAQLANADAPYALKIVTDWWGLPQ